MTDRSTDVTKTNAGVSFTVRVDYVNRECFISNAALVKLSGSTTLGSLETYRSLESTINGVARRLIRAGVAGTPLMLGPDTFNSANVSMRMREV